MQTSHNLPERPADLPALVDALPLVPGVRIYPQAMVFDRNLEWHEYQALYNALTDFHLIAANNLPFWLGDLLNHVELIYGETYAQLVDDLGEVRQIQTLRNYKWVCSKVPPEMRTAVSPDGKISFSLCKLAAGIEDPIRRQEALSRAVNQEQTYREFHAELRGLQPQDREPPVSVHTLTGLVQDAYNAVQDRDWAVAKDKLEKALIVLRRFV